MVLSASKCTKVLLYDRHRRPFLKGIPFLHLSLSLLVASDLRDKKQMIVVTGMGVRSKLLAVQRIRKLRKYLVVK